MRKEEREGSGCTLLEKFCAERERKTSMSLPDCLSPLFPFSTAHGVDERMRTVIEAVRSACENLKTIKKKNAGQNEAITSSTSAISLLTLDTP